MVFQGIYGFLERDEVAWIAILVGRKVEWAHMRRNVKSDKVLEIGPKENLYLCRYSH